MSFWEGVWRIGIPLIVVVSAAGAVWSAFSERPADIWRPRGRQLWWVPLWVIAAGEAAVGDNRWWFERACKGTTVLLLAVAIAIGEWRHYRWRRRRAQAAPSEPVRPA